MAYLSRDSSPRICESTVVSSDSLRDFFIDSRSSSVSFSWNYIPSLYDATCDEDKSLSQYYLVSNHPDEVSARFRSIHTFLAFSWDKCFSSHRFAFLAKSREPPDMMPDFWQNVPSNANAWRNKRMSIGKRVKCERVSASVRGDIVHRSARPCSGRDRKRRGKHPLEFHRREHCW